MLKLFIKHDKILHINNGLVNPVVNVVKITAVTHRKDNPIMQSVIGPSEEYVSMAGIPIGKSI